MNENVIKFEEKTIFKLRYLYKKHGYLPYKMSKFEEYELYSRNKDFLVSDRLITFNDTNGKLMALKPDVTLSIIKNGEDAEGIKQKVFYDENVYRVSESTHRFKEILQTGLECIGDIDIFDIYEVISLAAESLANISENFYIEISNLDVVYSLVAGICDDPKFIGQVTECLSQKNTHDLKKVCDSYSVSEADYSKISKLISLYGNRNGVLSEIANVCDSSLTEKMTVLSSLLDNSPYSDKIKFDFSVINDMNYYNGFVFRGFIDGICCGVLAGGQYSNMMKKMNRSSEAVGFALYLDRLDDLDFESEQYDVDFLLLYGNETDPTVVANKVNDLINKGFSVSAQKSTPKKLRFKEIIDIR